VPTSTTVQAALAKQVKSADIEACLALDQWTQGLKTNSSTVTNGLALRTVAEGLQANVPTIRDAANEVFDATKQGDQSGLTKAFLNFDVACKSIGLGPT
jgi:hypothetical protein